MKKLTLFVFILFGICGFAQKPNWINKDSRSSQFPTSQFLVGFIEVNEVNKKYIDEELEQLVDAAKSNLIQSVRVNVKSVSTSNVSDYNGEIEDYFNQKTTSNSDLQLIGLQTDSYYDKKTKKGYGFAYVNKSKMVEYYRSDIGKHIIDISNISDLSKGMQQSSDLQSAFKKGLECYNKFLVIEEDQKILLAIGANSSLDTRIEEVNELNRDFQKLMNSIKSDSRLTLDDAGFMIANGLLKFSNKSEGYELNEFTFEQTGFTSDFSYKLNETIEESLPSEIEKKAFKISGVYVWEGSNLVVKSKLTNLSSGNVVGRINVQLKETYLISNGITVEPQDIKNLKQLESISLESKTSDAQGKAGLGLDKDLVTLVSYNGKPLNGVPVRFFNSNGGTEYCSTISDAKGYAACRVKKISGEYKNQIIKSEIDLGKYLSNDSSVYVSEFLKNKDLPNASFKVQVLASTIYVQSTENNFGQSLDVNLIEPQLKQNLSGQGFEFTDTDSNTDYVIKIKASSRKGGRVGGVYFAYVDVSVSVFDSNLGKEIFKESINNVKGGGGTFDQAGGKAYYEAADLTRQKIETLLVD